MASGRGGKVSFGKKERKMIKAKWHIILDARNDVVGDAEFNSGGVPETKVFERLAEEVE